MPNYFLILALNLSWYQPTNQHISNINLRLQHKEDTTQYPNTSVLSGRSLLTTRFKKQSWLIIGMRIMSKNECTVRDKIMNRPLNVYSPPGCPACSWVPGMRPESAGRAAWQAACWPSSWWADARAPAFHTPLASAECQYLPSTCRGRQAHKVRAQRQRFIHSITNKVSRNFFTTHAGRAMYLTNEHAYLWPMRSFLGIISLFRGSFLAQEQRQNPL